MNAALAKSFVSNYVLKTPDRILSEIYKKIEAKARVGNASLAYYIAPEIISVSQTEHMVNDLRDRGYVVDEIWGYESHTKYLSYLNISWRDKPVTQQ